MIFQISDVSNALTLGQPWTFNFGVPKTLGELATHIHLVEIYCQFEGTLIETKKKKVRLKDYFLTKIEEKWKSYGFSFLGTISLSKIYTVLFLELAFPNSDDTPTSRK